MERWSEAEAQAWQAAQPWLVGCNYIPATAVNQLEMWQAESFDPARIDLELGWAASIGMNTVRVFLHDLLWFDPKGLFENMNQFLAIAASHGISTLFVFFDDCWHDQAELGPQAPPAPGLHNSGWLQSPGYAIVADPSKWDRLEAYVTGVVSHFANDSRILGWDVYNEPTNAFLPAQRLKPADRELAIAEIHLQLQRTRPLHHQLVRNSFEWARAAKPSQPLTAAAYTNDRELNRILFENSDVISFHNYEDVATLEKLIQRMKQYNRPLLCTEYMARTRDCDLKAQLPAFQRENIGCYNWGLVNGKTQTHIAWEPDLLEPLWFHDLLHFDGTPYDAAEVALMRELTGVAAEVAA